MNELQIFNYEGNQVRTVQRDGETWWVLKDVCNVLGLSNPTIVAERLDEDERAKFDLGRSAMTGGGGETNIINEAGLYNVIIRSAKGDKKPKGGKGDKSADFDRVFWNRQGPALI